MSCQAITAERFAHRVRRSYRWRHDARASRRRRPAFGLCCGFAIPRGALNPEGHGQALIYPYYTVRATDGNPFNTLITVVNTTTRQGWCACAFAKAANGRQVASFNLYLSPTTHGPRPWCRRSSAPG